MRMGDSTKQTAKLCLAVLCLYLLGISSSPLSTVRAQDTSQVVLSTYGELDDDATAWNVYLEGNPTWALENSTSLSLDGHSLRCAITGGSPYSNVHCYRNLPAEKYNNVFLLSMSFVYLPQSSFNNVGSPSIVQGLEFTMDKWQNGIRYEWALQWDNVDLGAPKWRYWNPSRSSQWVDTSFLGGISGMAWHVLKLEGGIFNGQVYYHRFIFDGATYPLDFVVAPASAAGEPDKLAVAVQLDGNFEEDPYEIILEHVTLVTSESFVDVPYRYWAFDWIQRLYSANITGGCGVGPLRYCPKDTVTRAEMAVFLERGIHGSAYNPPAVGSSTGFGDVQPGYWAAAWINQLAADGITGGCGTNLYCPEDPVTRAQMAVFLLKSKYGSGYTPPAVGASTGFTDVPSTHWAAPWIKQLAAEGITGGCGTGTYCPESPVTRAQMAVFLVRMFNLP